METTKCYCGHTNYCDCGELNKIEIIAIEERNNKNLKNMTAVEWLVEQLEQNKFVTESQIYIAKEMEKQQLIDCGNSCAFNQVIHNRKLDLMNLQQLEEFVEEEYLTFGEEYYNERIRKIQ